MSDTVLQAIKCPVSGHTLYEVETDDPAAPMNPPAQIICRCGLRLRLLAVNHAVILGGAKKTAVRVQ